MPAPKPVPPPVTVPPTVPSTVPPTTVPPAPTTTLPPPANGLTTSVAIDKLTFGPRPGLAAAIDARGLSDWIEDQLDPVGRGVPHAEARLAGYSTLTNTHRANYDVANSDGGSERLRDELDHATLLRAVYSERQLYELMCDFWSNHFNTWRQKTWMGFLKSRSHETVIRPHALGRFSDMLLASATDTAMLDYLDNVPSDASQPGGVNENYARELLELHTLGIIRGQQVYGEADVRGVARVMSGWSINWDDTPDRYTFQFHPWQHSLEAVSILGGAFTRPARTYGQGYADGVRLLDVLAHHPSTARYIAWKLCRRFVADDPPDSLVTSTAAVFSANGTAIVPTLRHLFGSAEFAASSRSKVRRPFEHVVACLRTLGADVPNVASGQATDAVRYTLENLGQPPFERETPDGYPDLNAAWMSSEGLLQRWAVAGRIARNRLTDSTQPNAIAVDLTKLMPSPLPGTVADLLVALAARLGNFTLDGTDVADLCTACAFTPTAAATTLSGDPTRSALAVGLLLSHPTFQKR
ncbi:MAG: DUF1800 domain-containing protein [Acidimicrobiales bacterium]